MDHTTQLMMAQKLEAEIKTHRGEVTRKRDSEYNAAQIKSKTAQMKALLPRGCRTCKSAAGKVRVALRKAGYFKRAPGGRMFAMTTQERDYALEMVMDDLY